MPIIVTPRPCVAVPERGFALGAGGGAGEGESERRPMD